LPFFVFVGEIDALVSAIPFCSLVSSPIFGPPAMADKATLIIALSGDYRSKKEVAYTLVPAIGRRVLDLGGNVEKGDSSSFNTSRVALIDKENYHTKHRHSSSLATLSSWALWSSSLRHTQSQKSPESAKTSYTSISKVGSGPTPRAGNLPSAELEGTILPLPHLIELIPAPLSVP
jgi:hypothetical protein